MAGITKTLFPLYDKIPRSNLSTIAHELDAKIREPGVPDVCTRRERFSTQHSAYTPVHYCMSTVTSCRHTLRVVQGLAELWYEV
jgi:hypothetical protein